MNRWVFGATVLASTMVGTVSAQVSQRQTTRSIVQRPRTRPDPVTAIRPRQRRPARVAVVEGEAFVATAHATDGRVSRQSMSVFGENWSGGAQLLWAPRRLDARLEITVNVPEAGRYALSGYLTKGPDYARYQLLANGKQIGSFDGFGRRVVRTERIALGSADLQAGENTILVIVTGRDFRATGYLVGIDTLEFSLLAHTPGSGTMNPEATRHRQPATLVPPTAPARVGRIGEGTILEGEQLIGSARAELGQPVRQSMVRFGRSWSGDAQLLWQAPRVGAQLFFTVDVPEAGNYTIAGWFTRAPDYGRFQLARLEGKRAQPLGAVIDAYHVRVLRSERIVLGNAPLEAGPNQFVLEIAGKDPRSTGYFVGIDALALTPETLSQADLVREVAAARSLPRWLSAGQRRELRTVARDLKYGRVDSARAHWEHVAHVLAYDGERDVDPLIDWVLHEAYVKNNDDLQDYAEKVRSSNEKEKPIGFGADEEAQLEGMELQSHAQKQQQTLQTMSNMSKMLHETAMAVIRKIGS